MSSSVCNIQYQQIGMTLQELFVLFIFHFLQSFHVIKRNLLQLMICLIQKKNLDINCIYLFPCLVKAHVISKES